MILTQMWVHEQDKHPSQLSLENQKKLIEILCNFETSDCSLKTHKYMIWNYVRNKLVTVMKPIFLPVPWTLGTLS